MGKRCVWKDSPCRMEGPKGTSVDVYVAHDGDNLLNQPHIGYHYGTKRSAGDKYTGHIVVDEVKAARPKEKDLLDTIDFYRDNE